MSADDAAERRRRRQARQAARCLSRLFGSGRQPLQLVAVPRDHVPATARAATPCSPAASRSAARRSSLAELDFAALGARRPARATSCRASPGCATSPPRPAARRARGWPRRSPGAGCSPTAPASTRPGRPTCGASASSSGPPMRPTSCRAATPAIARPCSTRWRAARGTSTPTPTRRRRACRGSPPGPGVVAAGLLVQGGVPRVARGEAGLMRALAAAQFEDGGLISRSPARADAAGRPARPAPRRLFRGQADACPTRIEAAAAAALAALHGVTMGDGALSSWQGGNPGDAGAARPRWSKAAACAPGRCAQARGWGYQRLSRARHDPRPRRRAAAAAANGRRRAAPRRWRSRCQRRRAAAGRQLRRARARCRPSLPRELVEALRTTAAHARWSLDDTNSTAILPDGIARQGRRPTSPSTAARTMTASRLEASHDGYVRGFGLVHQRRLIARQRRQGSARRGPADRRRAAARSAKPRPIAIRFHLAPGVERP